MGITLRASWRWRAPCETRRSGAPRRWEPPIIWIPLCGLALGRREVALVFSSLNHARGQTGASRLRDLRSSKFVRRRAKRSPLPSRYRLLRIGFLLKLDCERAAGPPSAVTRARRVTGGVAGRGPRPAIAHSAI